jgi:hypothetical protein
MNRFPSWAIAGGLSLAALAVGVSPSMAEPITTLDTPTLVPAVSQPQTVQDRTLAAGIPTRLSELINPATLRFLSEDNEGTYSVGIDPTGTKICVISQLKGGNSIAGASCLGREEFAKSGAKVGLLGQNGRSSTAYLLPGDVDASLLNAGRQGRASQLVTQAEADKVGGKAQLNRKNSNVKFEFSAIPLAHK